MKWSSAVSDKYSLTEAVAETAYSIHNELGEGIPDLVVAFVSAHHSPEYDALPQLIGDHFGPTLLLGCSGGGVIGSGTEIEQRPGFAITAALLPGVQLNPFHIESDAFPDGDAPPEEWGGLVSTPWGQEADFLILADPFSVDGEKLLMGLDYAFPNRAKIGGLASGARQDGGNALYLGDAVHNSGAVGISLSGNIVVDTVVAQGCRPIGEPMQVTGCEKNLLTEVDGRTPFEVLREIFAGLEERDRELAQNSLFMGVVMDEFNDSPQQGDFLIRNIIGVDAQKGVLAVGERLKEGQTVQFHLRDAKTSSQDLDAMLEQYMANHTPHADSGALLFSCLGRGAYLYGRADHDTDMFKEIVGDLPLTGFFCNGEIGPVGGSTFLHGYTSSFGIFRPKEG
ncbi:MAG: FIST C-terminal domain-containing protein [Chloroflexi bacterium]|nr:FIST C-terminal domain-containing protein [Chloroflexota bacterium]MDA1228512.1 FIST C-terminal domain-containing protein [Chloroflexota bacterium]